MELAGAEDENMHPVHSSWSFGLFAQTPANAGFCQMVNSCAIRASFWGEIAAPCPNRMDFRQLFKLRLLVAALGQSQRLEWCKSGVLMGTREFLFQQGFPRSSPFAQTRAGFQVAQLACDETLAIQPTPGGPNTCHLFRLTPQLEDAYENERNRWLDEPQALLELAELDPEALDWACQQTPQTAKALRLDAPFEINQEHIERLAAGFVCDPMPPSPQQL